MSGLILNQCLNCKIWIRAVDWVYYSGEDLFLSAVITPEIHLLSRSEEGAAL